MMLTVGNSKEENELLRKMKITCNGKYKYLDELAGLYKDEFNPNIDLKQVYQNDKNQSGIRLFVNPDEEFDCYLVPGINIIAGMTGHGKSMIGNSIAYRAVKSGLNVLYISLEIVKKNILYQMLSIYSNDKSVDETGISHSDIKRHKLNLQQEEEVFDELWPEFNKLKGNLYILDEWEFDTSSSESLQEKLFLVEEYAQQHTGKGLDLIVVDYIQLFKSYKEKNATKEYEVLSLWTNDFRRMSKNFLGQNHEIPILLLSQLNREAWNDELLIQKKKSKNEALPPNKRKQLPDINIGLSQIAGCVEIAKAADTAYAIYCNDSLKSSSQCYIFMLKNRDGVCNGDNFVCYMNPKYYIVGCSDKFKTEWAVDIGTVFNEEMSFDFTSATTPATLL